MAMLSLLVLSLGALRSFIYSTSIGSFNRRTLALGYVPSPSLSSGDSAEDLKEKKPFSGILKTKFALP